MVVLHVVLSDRFSNRCMPSTLCRNFIYKTTDLSSFQCNNVCTFGTFTFWHYLNLLCHNTFYSFAKIKIEINCGGFKLNVFEYKRISVFIHINSDKLWKNTYNAYMLEICVDLRTNDRLLRGCIDNLQIHSTNLYALF